MRHFFYVLFLLVISTLSNSYGQVYTLSGTTTDTIGSTLPYIHYNINHGQIEGLTSLTGEYKVTLSNPIYHIVFYSYAHDSIEYDILQTDTILDVKFQNQGEFKKVKHTDFVTKSIIKEVLAHKNDNKPENIAPFHYETYNKFYVSTNEIKKTKTLINKYLSFIKLSLKDYPKKHHILLTESVTTRDYLSPLNNEERIEASRVSGIDKPGLFTLNSKMQLFSIYDPFLRIASKNFTNPINPDPFLRYNFELIDKSITQKDTLFIIQFYPVKNARFESLKGLLYIHSWDYAIEKAILTPAMDKKYNLILYHSAEKTMNGHWFPHETYTKMQMYNMGKTNINLTANYKSIIKNVVSDTTFKINNFDEYSLKFNPKIITDSVYWKEHRSIPLTEKDKNTFEFYNKIGHINNFQNVLLLGERLYFKKVPYKWFNLDLNHLIKVNGYEIVRLGGGFETNNKFSNKLQLHVFSGFGFKDQKIKYGGSATLKINETYRSYLKLGYENNLHEAGQTTFFNDRSQYATEWLRKLTVYTMDNYKKIDVTINASLFRYLSLNATLARSQITPLYHYSFADNQNSFITSTLKIGGSYGYGERYFKLINERISFGSKYPKVWFQYTLGLHGMLGSTLPYHQYDAKVEYTKKFLDFGITSAQVTAGYKTKKLPFPLLYGAKSGAAAVAHNSFETMRFNEFQADEYINFFFAHDFGYSNFIEMKNFRPKIELDFNCGYGLIDTASISQHHFSDDKITIQDYRHGYYEGGILAKNLLTIRYSGVKLGLGAAYFIRFGYYAHDSFLKNSLVKVTINLRL